LSPYDFPGLVSGIIGFQLALWGTVLAVLSGLRALLVRGQPGRGHVARGLFAASGILVAGGAAVLALAELTDWQRALDSAVAPLLAGVAVVGGGALAVAIARRRPLAAAGAAPDRPGPDEPPPP
jgi:hypothetical protein